MAIEIKVESCSGCPFFQAKFYGDYEDGNHGCCTHPSNKDDILIAPAFYPGSYSTEEGSCGDIDYDHLPTNCPLKIEDVWIQV